MEIFTLNLCWLEKLDTDSVLSAIITPTWPQHSRLVSKDSTTYHLITFRISVWRTSLIPLVPFRYFMQNFNLIQSSSSSNFDQIVMKSIWILIYMRYLLNKDNIWSTILWKLIACYSDNSLTSLTSLTLNTWCDYGFDAVAPNSLRMLSRIYFTY